LAPTGRLYVGLGDGESAGDPQRRAQDPRSRLGKMLRLSVGASPVTVGVYAKGLRNPWRFSFDRKTGALWIGDVGQDEWEEVDYLRPGRPAGANLGWNGYEGTHVYDRTTATRLDRGKLVWPATEYSHSLGTSVTGGDVYRGSALPALRGWHVFGDFAAGRVWAMNGPRGTPEALPGADRAVGSISSFGEDAAGELYIVDIGGAVHRITPAVQPAEARVPRRLAERCGRSCGLWTRATLVLWKRMEVVPWQTSPSPSRATCCRRRACAPSSRAHR